MITKPAVLLVVLCLALTGCRSPGQQEDRFAIYLMADEIPASQLAETDLDRLVIQDNPVISSEDIVSYTAETHMIELTGAAYKRFKGLYPMPVRVDGIPFVVCVGDQRIYVGALWTPVSSLSFDGPIIMQPFEDAPYQIQIGLGYPGPDFSSGRDPRSDPRILEALREDGKLK